MPTRFGPKPRPVLKVVDWRGVASEPPKQIDRPEYAADRIGTHPRRMQDEPPPHTEVPPAHDDDEITF
jgi:hypothetical protein